ncbi:MAG: hypothetical protein HOM58_00550 [Rhodospirillaceae bacterium]|jgi:hypothetical protein|nr:hypothetical protein [Rhodospirillaceae bacterium]
MKNVTKIPVIRSSLHNASRAGRAAKRWHLSGDQGVAAPDLAPDFAPDFGDDSADARDQDTPDTPSVA